MKDYIVFAFRINVALLLATILISAFVVPLISALIAPLLINYIVSISLEKIDLIVTIASLVSLAIIIFCASYWVFKRTFRNTKKSKEVTLGKCILYSLILKIIIDIAFLIFTKEINIISYCSFLVVNFIAFYLAGRSVERSLKTE